MMVMVEKNQSVIDKSMTIVGEVTCSGRLFVKGKINGNFHGRRVIIGEDGEISGEITANEIECCGHIEGNVVTDKFVMRKNGCHLGTVETKVLEIDPGANIDCVLQSGFPKKSGPLIAPVDLKKVCSVLDEREKFRAQDVLWSERKELFDQVAILLERGKQLIKITGEKGSGKTTFIKMLRERLAPGTKVFVIAEPVGSVKDLLFIFAADLGISSAEDQSYREIVLRIKTAVCELGAEESGIVLAVDDAHMMYPATMEGIIRCLTSVYGGDEKLLQLIFFGTDEFEGQMVPATREYFEDETNCLLTLEPLTIKDTAEYLRFCIRFATNNNSRVGMSLFPYETITKLHILSKGNISEINRLAGKALHSAFQAGVTAIEPRFL